MIKKDKYLNKKLTKTKKIITKLKKATKNKNINSTKKKTLNDDDKANMKQT